MAKRRAGDEGASVEDSLNLKGPAAPEPAAPFASDGALVDAVAQRNKVLQERVAAAQMPDEPPGSRRLWQTALYFLCMILFLVFSDWYNTNDVTITMKDGGAVGANIRYSTRDALDVQEYEPDGRLSPEVRRIDRKEIVRVDPVPSFTSTVHGVKWYLAGAMGLLVLLMVWRWFSREEVKEWLQATWEFGLMIVPLLFGGVFVTGFVGALIPQEVVAGLVGGNSPLANLVASFVGLIWYFATLTEIPILESLIGLGMGR